MTEQDQVDDLPGYVRQNRERFTREAMTERLLAAGHAQAEIDAAFAEVSTEPWPGAGADSMADASAAPPPRSAVVGVVSGLLILVAILGFGGAVLLGLAGAALSYGPIAMVWLLLYSVAMLVGGIYSIRRLAGAPSAEKAGRAIFIALAISVAIFGGLSGVCFVGLGNI